MHEAPDPEFDVLKRDILAHPRQSGYYILKLVTLAAGWENKEEQSLDALFQYCDDHPWPPVEDRQQGGRWADYETDEDGAQRESVAALVGGRDVGQLRETIKAKEAAELWRRFRALFSRRARYFTRLGLGRQEYVFQRGVVIVDERRAGAMCVVEND
jgi:hypothetical protein